MDCLDNRGPAARRDLLFMSYPQMTLYYLRVEQDPLYLQKKMLTPGQKAPAFSLYNSEKQLVTLQEFSGKKNVLLLFFPLAFTSVCTDELCAIRDDIETYNNDQVQVFGISVDSTDTLGRFKEDQHYNYPLLSDFNKEVSALYDTLYSSFSVMEMKGVSKRSAFVIDKQGIVQYAEVLEKPYELPDFDTIRQHLKRLSV